MAITAQQVNELRKKTGAGMMDCKKALIEADGDFEKAIEILRKRGAAVAAKRAEKSANEGLVITKVSDDMKTGVMAEINCETDFVAKSDEFTGFANSVLETIFNTKPASVDELLKSNPKLMQSLQDILGKIGEKIEISRFTLEHADNGLIVDYVHLGSKLGVLIVFDNVTNAKDAAAILAKDIAMQVAAMKPLCVYREEVPKDIIDKEIDIYKELARKEGKPEQILEKIALGKLNKFYQDNCLNEQMFVKDNSKSVGELIKEFNSKNGSNIKIAHFKRFHLSDENK
jgi:elongation factor Ts